jgi:hypothetical protein
MDFNVPVCCYKCGKDFNALEKDNDLPHLIPLQDEGGFTRKAICSECKTDCGEISVTLIIK